MTKSRQIEKSSNKSNLDLINFDNHFVQEIRSGADVMVHCPSKKDLEKAIVNAINLRKQNKFN